MHNGIQRVVSLGMNADRSASVPLILKPFGANPVTVFQNVVKKYNKTFRQALKRTNQRTGRKRWVGSDPTSKKKFTMNLVPLSDDSNLELSVKALAMLKLEGKAFADELARVVSGRPMGKGLDDEAGNALVSYGTTVRHLFGVDDAVIIGAVVTLAAALLPVLLSTLLPMVLDAGSKMIVGGDKPIDENGDGIPDAEQTPTAPEADGTSDDTLLIAGAVLAALGLVGVFIWHRKKRKAA